jgi:hypothetical protein
VAGGVDPLLLQAVENIRQRHGAQQKPPPENVLEWAERYRRIDDQQFCLDHFEPIRALYEDDHPNMVVIKPAQRGISEWAVSYACFALEWGAKVWVPEGRRKSGLNVGYIFPTAEALRDFSKERISSLQEESTHLAMLFGIDSGDYDSLGFKKVGQSYFYLRGGHTTHVISFPADVLILDEYDQMNQTAISLVRRRLNASVVKRMVKISTPTYPGRGIHAEYLMSDQRIYQTLCEECQEWVSFEFFRDVHCDGMPYSEGWRYWSIEQIERAETTLNCPKCHSVVDDDVRCAKGRWHTQKPEIVRTRGYWVPWWPFTFVDMKSLCISAISDRSEEVTELYRSDLGLPYGAGGGALTEDLLMQCAAEAGDAKPNGPWHDTTMGVDIGSRLNYRISSLDANNRPWVRAMGTVTHWHGPDDSLDALMHKYAVRMCVVDYEPEMRNALDFCGRWKGRANCSLYLSNPTSLKGKLYNVKEDAPLVQVNRTMAMDDLLLTIQNTREIWLASLASDPDIAAQMIAPTRVLITDEDGQSKPQWVHTTPDHYFHASVYDMIARRLLPANKEMTPAVGGNRPLLQDYQRYLINAGGRNGKLDPRTVR